MGRGVGWSGRWSGVIAATAVIAVVSGCGFADSGRRDARDAVDRLLSTTAMSSYTTDIHDFARAAAEARTSVELIGIESAATSDGVLGTLTFLVLLPEQRDQKFVMVERDRGPHCFETVFGQWGAIGGAGSVPCPVDATPVTPPPSDAPVVANNARAAAHAVLEALDAAALPDAATIAAGVTALLEAPSDGRPVAEAGAVVDGARVGVAMGDADDCVLVAWNVEVRDIYVPRISLQPGELGCRPETALADVRPPH